MENRYFRLAAAASTNIGRIRTKNEDNLFFDGKALPLNHKNLRYPARKRVSLKEEHLFCVFDGMGGEEYGEVASYIAAGKFKQEFDKHNQVLENVSDLLNEACNEANRAVVAEAESRGVDYIGATLAALLFTSEEVYVCNIGDSRILRLRDNELMQISEDHVESMPPRDDDKVRKPRITQFLGLPEDEVLLEPYIAKAEIKAGDQYLICSDGVTDMLSNIEIYTIMQDSKRVTECVDKLVKESLAHGGRDNITAIVCRVI